MMPSTMPVVAAPLLAAEVAQVAEATEATEATGAELLPDPAAADTLGAVPDADEPDDPAAGRAAPRVRTGAGCSGSALLPGAARSIHEVLLPSL